jgi:hypothetical protein
MSTNFKSIKADKSTETRDNHSLEQQGTGNLFETIVVLSSRSNQLAVEMKQELNAKLEEFITPTDSLEEVFENREQIEISRFYERLPKPHSIAIAELGQDSSIERCWLGKPRPGARPRDHGWPFTGPANSAPLEAAGNGGPRQMITPRMRLLPRF